MPKFERLEVDKNITNDLGQYIEITMKKWYNLIEKRPVTLEEFRSYSIPKGDVIMLAILFMLLVTAQRNTLLE